MKWAIVEEPDGDVNCPHCGRCNPKICDYGIFDDESYYFIIKCEKCGTKSAYLDGSDFKSRYVGDGDFNIRGVN